MHIFDLDQQLWLAITPTTWMSIAQEHNISPQTDHKNQIQLTISSYLALYPLPSVSVLCS